MGNSHFFSRRGAAALLLSALCAGPLAAAGCREDRVGISGGFGRATFEVDVAADKASRARGLMHVEHMPPGQGMLFVYDRPQQLTFWMRNTLIELDMLFVDARGVIRHIHHRAQPLDETIITPGSIPLIGVLEINGGLAGQLGIAVGDLLVHPAFSSATVPGACDD